MLSLNQDLNPIVALADPDKAKVCVFNSRILNKCVENADSKLSAKSRMYQFRANADSIGVVKWNVKNATEKGPNSLV